MTKSTVADIEKMKANVAKWGCLDRSEALELISAYENSQAEIMQLRLQKARLELKLGMRPKLTLVKPGKPGDPQVTVKLDQPKRETDREASPD